MLLLSWSRSSHMEKGLDQELQMPLWDLGVSRRSNSHRADIDRGIPLMHRDLRHRILSEYMLRRAGAVGRAQRDARRTGR